MLESYRSRYAAGAAATLLLVLALAASFGAFNRSGDGAPPARANVSARAAETLAFWPAEIKADAGAWTGRLSRLDSKVALLTVRGSPEERGTAHGKLLDVEVRRLVGSVKAYLLPRPNDEEGKKKFAECLSGARVMKQFLEADVLQELDACAKAAGVDADELLLTQLFGDVNRAKGFASFCTAFAAFGPATQDGRLLVGRNFDYAGHGLEGTLPLILQEIPHRPRRGSLVCDGRLCGDSQRLDGDERRRPLRQQQYALRRHGPARGRRHLLPAAAHCRALPHGRRGSCADSESAARLHDRNARRRAQRRRRMGRARFVEFDAEKCESVEPAEGMVLSSNSRQKLAVGRYAPDVNPSCTRYQALKTLLTRQRGKLTFTGAPPVAGSGVYMAINLHCALLDPQEHRLRVAFSDGSGRPAAEFPFQTFEILKDRIVLKE